VFLVSMMWWTTLGISVCLCLGYEKRLIVDNWGILIELIQSMMVGSVEMTARCDILCLVLTRNA
jgi:hypothetical protein